MRLAELGEIELVIQQICAPIGYGDVRNGSKAPLTERPVLAANQRFIDICAFASFGLIVRP